MTDLFSTFKATLTNSQAYGQIISQSFKKALFYFTAWYGMSGLIISLILNLTLIPKAYQTVQQVLDQVQSDYPDQLTINLRDGQLFLDPETTSVPVTFTNPLPDTPIPILLLIDPSVPAESITETQALILATKNAVAIRQSTAQDSTTIFKLTQLVPEPLTITKIGVEQIMAQSRDLFASLYQTRWLILPLIVTFSLIISRLLFLVVYTLPLFLTTLMTGRPLPLLSIWKISLHTIVLTDLVILMIKTLYQQPLTWLYALAFLGITTIALISLRSPTAQTPPA